MSKRTQQVRLTPEDFVYLQELSGIGNAAHGFAILVDLAGQRKKHLELARAEIDQLKESAKERCVRNKALLDQLGPRSTHVPRTRGDEPERSRDGNRELSCSPHTRG